MVYSYQALFVKNHNGYFVTFPDVPGCMTEGRDLAEAKRNAEDALGLLLSTYENEGTDIPARHDVSEQGFETLEIECDTDEYRAVNNH